MTGLRKRIRYALKARETWKVIADSLGWKRSFDERRPLDGQGNPIPWYTYPAIEYLRNLQLNDCRVFEYGSGNSSLFWAERVKQVVAVENNPAWADEVRARNVSNLMVITAVDKDEYVNTPLRVGGRFDIVIIDGRHRTDCAAVAADLVDDQGLIIFDNADWYPKACILIRSKGWLQIDFSGLGPINPHAWTTSLFVRSSVRISHIPNFSPVGGNPDGAACD